MTLYQDVYDEFMENAKDPAWLMAFEIALGEWMQDIAVYHQGPMQAIVDRAALRKLGETQDELAKRFLLARVEEIRKDRKPWDESKVRRNKDGEFTRGGAGGGMDLSERRNTGPGARQVRNEALTDYANRIARPDPSDQGAAMDGPARRGMFMGPDSSRQNGFVSDVVGRMSTPVDLDNDGETDNVGDNKAEALKLAASMTYELSARTGDPKDKQRIQYTIIGVDGQPRIKVPEAGTMPTVDWESGERIKFMAPVGPDHPVQVAGKVMNVGLIAGRDSRESAKLGAIAADIQDSLNTTDWGRRLQNTANTLAIVSNDNPTAVKAHAVAQMINLLGPDAARAFGPKMRQLSYRYTGQEALPEQMSAVAQGGRQEGESQEGFRARLVEDLKNDLPTETEYKASLQSGSTPPSKGYIVNKNGKVTSEAVGFSDDWYAPFNLSKLPSARNGEYVRTRGYGGLTPEDIRLAMRTGVKDVTIVSNTGTYHVEFDPRSLNFGHRFGFGGNSMIRRYTKSLDAIQNGKVENADSPLGQGGQRGKLQLDHRGYQAALQDLKVKYPYFIKNVSFVGANQEGNKYPNGKSPNAQQADNDGYTKPLAVKAQGTRAGWGNEQRQAYDQLEQYQMRQSTLLGLKNNEAFKNRAAQPAATPVGGARPQQQPWLTAQQQRVAQQAQQATGQGRMQASATNNPADRMRTSDADQVLDEFRKVFLTEIDKELDSERLNDMRDLLFSDDPEDARAKQSFRDKFANNITLRQELLDELVSSYEDSPKAKRLFSAIDVSGNGGRNDEADDDGTDEASGFYDKHTLIPNAKLDNSPKLREYTLALEGRNETEALANMKWYREQMARFNGNEEGLELLDEMRPANQERFMRIHEAVTRILNDELQDADEAKNNPGQAAAEARVSDREVQTPGGERPVRVSPVNTQKIMSAGTAQEAAWEIFSNIDYDNDGISASEMNAQVEDAKKTLLRIADAARKTGQKATETKVTATYDELEVIQLDQGLINEDD